VQQIAFVGLDQMDSPMCVALVWASYQASGPTACRAQDSRRGGGVTWRDTPDQTAAAAGVPITMCPGPVRVALALAGSEAYSNGALHLTHQPAA
jgi:3-hydroxyisobutyrate dehydrogenase-like beta-hydroxyacid dehydrogenase